MKKLIITCEHGGNLIPAQYKHLFTNADKILESHRGYDAGALSLAKHLQKELNAPFYFSTVSRLLIDLNRSTHHPNLFSSFSKMIPSANRGDVVEKFYLPYRNPVEDEIRDLIKNGFTVVHISIHSFTPILNNIERNCDIGILYDPKSQLEKDFSLQWKKALKEIEKSLKIRLNYPYRGYADGFTTYLRGVFPKNYLGIELEANQKYLEKEPMKSNETITASLLKLLPN